jgi:hypothetical protein
MTTNLRSLICGALLLLLGGAQGAAVELKVNRGALERTLRQQLFSGPDGRYYLRGNARSACSVYAQDAQISFIQDRILVRVKTHARLGKSIGIKCLGVSLSPTAEVSVSPFGEGETIGFRDAQVVKVSGQRELDFLLSPFLRHQIPSSMQVNAAELLRRALASSTASSGYQVNLDRLKIHSIQIEGDSLVVDVDGALSVR